MTDDLAKYILICVGSKYGDELVDLHENITLEHIMPKSLVDSKTENDQNQRDDDDLEKWRTSLGKKWEEIAKENIYKMGNLTLLTRKKNSVASNKEFKEKKKNILI